MRRWQMPARLGVVIESAMKVPGVVAAVLVNSDGHVIECASWAESDLASAGAFASQMFRQWASAGADLGLGDVRSMLIERPGGPVTIAPLGQCGALVVIGNRTCRPGHLRFETRHARERVGEGTCTAPEPAINSPTNSDAEFDERGQKTDRVDPTPNHLTTGEVVLVGAHTFRLVTKLVSRLLQTKGVRSSRLRAYSPSSTIIDVMLEEGATLTAIGGSCLDDELSIEPTAPGGARLVLRAAKASLGSPTPIGSPG
jgi:predicted regulator of Ras-like GTPase activity (Roadblock/LC7/MglB family)